MKKFMDKDFLLNTETAKKLYHEHASKMPIIDYHCHLIPKEIYEDKKFKNLTEVWLGPGDRTGDHYKWRSLRAMGYKEDSISGKYDDKEKFNQYVKAMPYFVGNPLYHWSHLEMQRYFGITDVINENNADKIWEIANKKLETLTSRKMMELFNVEVVCTTDDPIDSLEYHIKMKEDKTLKTKVHPTFRPDKLLNIETQTWPEYIEKLSKVSDIKITDLDSLLKALTNRIDFFAKNGCSVSDHGLEIVYYKDATKEEVDQVVKKALAKKPLTQEDLDMYKGYILVYLGAEYTKRNWVQQYHIGAIRNNSERNFKTLGPDTGFDGIGDSIFIEKLSKILSKQDSTNNLPKTILYCLNNRDNYALTVLAGCFQKEGTRGHVQVGSGWWFLDQQDGMRQNFETLMQVGLIANAVGMLTDSRSFLAYPRHEYYRRILCDMLGNLVESGQYPQEELPRLGQIVEDICYNNAKKYFNF